jgi:hypothetical protein
MMPFERLRVNGRRRRQGVGINQRPEGGDMHRVLLIALMLGVAVAVEAQTVPVVREGKIVEYGIYQIARTGEHIAMSSTAAGAVEPAKSAELVTATNRVPAVVGKTFGCMFVVDGEPEGATVTLEIVVEHPPFERTPGEKTGTMDRVPYSYMIGQKAGYTYSLDNAWEAVPGNWSIQVRYQGRKLAEQKFVADAK